MIVHLISQKWSLIMFPVVERFNSQTVDFGESS